MPDPNIARDLEAVVRGVATAAKTLRLYPPSSPIPLQSAQGAVAALQQYLAGQPVLPLTVVRDGFSCAGEPVAAGMPGAADLADLLRSHGIAELDLLAGCGTAELVGFLTILSRSPEDVRASGGLAALLASEGIESVRVIDVSLTVAAEALSEEAEDVDEFLRGLAMDPRKLAEWIEAAAHGDPAALADGLAELRRAAGDEGGRIAEVLAEAFATIDHDGKDAILGVAMESGEVRRLAGQALGLVANRAIADALCGGAYGQNMLSLSSALTRLPIAERMSGVFDEVSSALAEMGRSDKEADFLEHMLQIRAKAEPEPALAGDESYRSVAEAAKASAEEVGAARGEASDEHAVTARSVSTLLALLDQQTDFELYCRAADSLAGTVPRLLGHGDLPLADRVVSELANRAGRSQQPWPGLEERLRHSIGKAFSAAAIRGLLEAIAEDSGRADAAAGLVRQAGETASERIAAEAVALKEPGLAAAERLIGRRLLDQLAMLAPRLQWYQLAPVARRLACETDHRHAEALRGMLARADEQSRREVAQGLAGAGEAGRDLLGTMLKDPSMQVVIVAARGLARTGGDAGARALAARLAELDVDGKDFVLARELISALARIPGDGASSALKRLASRKALIKRGHFAEVQQLAAQAVELQARAEGDAA